MSTDPLKSLENWSHYHPIILKAGRCTHVAPEHITDDAELEEYMNKLNEEDKSEDRFRAINEDTTVLGYSDSAWLSKVAGDT